MNEDRTARSILEARLGRALGPIRAMPRDLRRAMFLLALQLTKFRHQIEETAQ